MRKMHELQTKELHMHGTCPQLFDCRVVILKKENLNDLREPCIHYLNKWEEIILYGVNEVAMSTTSISHCYGVLIKVNHLGPNTLNSKVLVEHNREKNQQ